MINYGLCQLDTVWCPFVKFRWDMSPGSLALRITVLIRKRILTIGQRTVPVRQNFRWDMSLVYNRCYSTRILCTYRVSGYLVRVRSNTRACFTDFCPKNFSAAFLAPAPRATLFLRAFAWRVPGSEPGEYCSFCCTLSTYFLELSPVHPEIH